MPKNPIQILCLGDLHLGRHPARVPERLDGPALSPRHVWHQTVERAIQSGVDVVVITGDVIDLEHRYFGAYGAFLEGVQRLEREGVPLVCVGGNHDAETLPRMVQDVGSDNVRLLGQNGTWERYDLQKDGDVVLQIDGWSFPSEHVAGSPLEGYDLPQAGACPQVGVLHADLGGTDVRYAPVATRELIRTSHDAWLLGHIHAPGVRHERDPLVLYPGSPQPLDPGETGSHGPWLITVKNEADGVIRARQIPLATVRYDRMEIDMGEARDLKDIPPLLNEGVEDFFDREGAEQALQLMLLRIVFQGRSSLHSRLLQKSEQLRDELELPSHGVQVVPEKIEVRTRPAVDLEELAQGDSPVAYLAGLIMDLEGEGNNLPQELLTECRDAMQEAYGATTYKHLRGERVGTAPGRDGATEVLMKQARLLLDTLLEQKEGEQ